MSNFNSARAALERALVAAPKLVPKRTEGWKKMPPFKGNVSELPLNADESTKKMNLGKRVLYELAGTQTFRADEETGGLVAVKEPQTKLMKKASVKQTAAYLGLTPRAVTKIAKAYESGGTEAVESLRWGPGRPTKNRFFT